MEKSFPETAKYLSTVNLETADPLDKAVSLMFRDKKVYDKAFESLRRRFIRGAAGVEAMDRGGRKTLIKRERESYDNKYYIQGADGSWSSPEEKIWIAAMYYTLQASK